MRDQFSKVTDAENAMLTDAWERLSSAQHHIVLGLGNYYRSNLVNNIDNCRVQIAKALEILARYDAVDRIVEEEAREERTAHGQFGVGA